MMRLLTTLSLLFFTASVFAQKPVFQGQHLKQGNHPELEAQFNAYEMYQLEPGAFHDFVKNAGASMEFTLKMGTHNWDIWLTPRDIRSNNYVRTVLTVDGGKTLPKGDNLTYRGMLQEPDGGAVALTVDEDFIYGFVKKGGEFYFIEPAWYFVPGTPKDRFVVYAASDVIPKKDAKCGFDEMKKYMQAPEPDDSAAKEPSLEKTGCKTVELAIASDKLMYNKYGSAGAVEGHNIGVMNNVQTNYDNEFNDELDFEIVQQFTVVPPANDPWTNSTNAGALLNSFTSWGPSGFSATHDIGQLWTNRNFDGPVIGIAWLNGVCNNHRYHCLQDFTSNAQLLRVLTSHEIGHNFSATHDPSGSNTIMAPAVTNTNLWSTQSQNQINGYYPGRWCLSNCPGLLPPVAAFTVTPNSGCAPLTVTYNDQSTNSPTSWSWTFPGGTPGTSTQQNPTVTYSSPGSYGATLTATNGIGSNTLTQNNIVTVETIPTANFIWTQVGLALIFTNTSTPNAQTYLWDFGDSQTSTQANPIHTYADDGFYTVTLTATNDCGSNTSIITIPVFTMPIAGFSGDPVEGCAALEVNFTDESSSNVLEWVWQFPGGSPATSTNANPTVLYSAPGVYTVTLTVSNPAGSGEIIKTNYITVTTIPDPGFSFSVNGDTATFTNTSSNALNYDWNFGDDSTSTAENPVHIYAASGNYDVTMSAINDCGTATITQTVTIDLPPTAGFSADTTAGCEPFEVTFNSSTSENAASYLWGFPGGDPDTSTAQNPVVTYNTPGTYDVTLIVSNPAGNDTLTLVDYITVNPLPAAGFTNSANGNTVTFTNTSANATSYAWDFGDSATSTEENPVHTYNSDGTYTVTLTATNDCGDMTTTQTVVIVTPPTAGFSANVTSGCAPLTVQFNNESSENATSFEWDFPGGDPSSSTAENPSVIYTATGTYTVTLTVSNAAGSNSVTQTNYITVTTVPAAGFTTSVSNATVDFTNTSVNATTYAWDFGDSATSTDTDPAHTYANDGTYTVTLIATNGCGPDTTSQTVTIVTPPTAGFSANTTTGCAPLTVTFTNESSENATSWNWDFPGGDPASSSDENPTVTYNSAGTYSVTLSVSNAAGADTVTFTNYIVVTTVPAPGFTVSTNVFESTFTNTTLIGTSYSWDFGDSQTSTEENPVHTYAGDGTYTVTLTATNDCGTATYTEDVVITSLPQAGFSANESAGCAPFTVQFMDESSSNATSWQWEFPGGNPSSSTEQNPTVTYSEPGTYTATLTVSNALGENTLTQTNYITVNTVPVAGFTSSAGLLEVTFTNTSTNATSYLWDFGDSQTSTEENPVHTYANDGTYTVTLTATNECGSVTTTQEVTVITPPTAGFSVSGTQGCAPFTVQFSNESSENATSWQWEFPGGTPATSTDENPTVVYNAAGTYTVTLTATNAAGNSTVTQTDLIVVNDVPAASFTSSGDLLDVAFTNTSTNATSYSWDFGDSQNSTEENPVHTYAGDGTYTVTLTATNECGSVTTTQEVTVITPPTAGFSAAVTEGCVPLTVEFINESSENATTFQWEFPGGTPAISNEENPVVIYNTPGTYAVTLTASNPAGNDVYSLVEYITVLPLPQAAYAYDEMDGTVTFINGSSNATSYEWNFGDNQTSTEENPVHSYTEDGVYTVTLTSVNDCGSVTTSQTIVVAFQAPVAFFTAENTNGCAPLEVTFLNMSSENATSFEWEFPGGTPATSTDENPVVVYNAPGTYDVTLTASNLNGSDVYTQSAYIVVNTVPETFWSFDQNLGTVTFTNTSANATSYEWTFGDGETSAEENPVHVYQSSGEFEVTMTAFNECGFTSNTQTILINLTGVEEIPGIGEFNIFPNPNSGQFTLALKGQPYESLELSFTNILGQQLLSETVGFGSGQLVKEFGFAHLPGGTYVFSVKSGARVLFRKVVVE
jgi:PKD repeat protein